MDARHDTGVVGGETGVAERAQGCDAARRICAAREGKTRREQSELAARAYLSRGRQIDASVCVLLAQLDELNAVKKRVGDNAELIERLREETLNRVEELRETRRELAATIARVGDAEVRAALVMRCLTYKTWPQIGLALGLDESAAKRRYARGAKVIGEVLELERDL